MEDLEGDLAIRESCWPVEVGWGSLHHRGREHKKHWLVQDSFTAECRREGIFSTSSLERLTKSLLKNNYINPSVQKSGIPGGPGCLERIAVVTQLIRNDHENRGNLAVLRFHLANAYGSIPHKLAKLHHPVPSKIKDLILPLPWTWGSNWLRWNAEPVTESGVQQETCQVPGTSGRVQGQRLEYILWAHRSRL